MRVDLGAAMGSLMAVAELAENDAVRRFEALPEQGVGPGAETTDERLRASMILAEAATVAVAAPLALPVSALLSYWGYRQRGRRDQTDLLDAGLTTDPVFLAGFFTSALACSSTSLGVDPARDLLRIRVALPNIEGRRRCAGLFASLADTAAGTAALTARIEALTGA